MEAVRQPRQNRREDFRILRLAHDFSWHRMSEWLYNFVYNPNVRIFFIVISFVVPILSFFLDVMLIQNVDYLRGRYGLNDISQIRETQNRAYLTTILQTVGCRTLDIFRGYELISGRDVALKFYGMVAAAQMIVLYVLSVNYGSEFEMSLDTKISISLFAFLFQSRIFIEYY